jgi:integrase
MKTNQLSARKVATATEPGYYGDGGGLYLQVSEKYRSRNWVFRFSLGGRAREMGLGSVNLFSLAEARERAHKCRQLLADGVDPIEDRKRRRDLEHAATADKTLFKDAATRFLNVHAPAWKNVEQRRMWESSLVMYAYPTLARRPIEAITGAVLTETLAPIWTKQPATAQKVKQRVTKICEWIRLGQPVPQTSPSKRVKHRAALPFAEVPAFMKELHQKDALSARALEFTILNAVRVSDTCGARWDEIDFDAGTWTIGDGRHKTGKEFVVPLSSAALALVKSQPRKGAYVFKVNRRSVSRLLEGMGHGSEVTVHGFRSSFRDWAGDKTNHPREVIEACMSHQIKDKAEAAYRRSDAIEKRRALMEEWGVYCGE